MNADDLIKKSVEQAQAGNEAGFEVLFDAFHDRIAQYAFRRVLDLEASEDITASVFLNVVKALPRFKWKHEHSFSGWIFRIANNEVNQYLRRRGKYRNFAPEESEMIMDDADRSQTKNLKIEKLLDQHTSYIELNKQLTKLKPKQQDLIHLYYFENLNHKEIGQALKMREGAARVAVHRAVDALRKQLDNNPINASKLQERST